MHIRINDFLPKFRLSIDNIIVVVFLIYMFIKIFTSNPVQDEKLLEQTTESSQTTQTVVDLQPSSSSDVSLPDSNYFKVVKVVDGDTIDILVNGKTERIRLLGIDTPETVNTNTPIQCYGKEASDKVKSILSGEVFITLESDSSQGDKDKYGRYLRYVYLENGIMLNRELLMQGYAHEYTYDKPYKYQQEFRRAESYAKQSNLGLWNQSICPSSTN